MHRYYIQAYKSIVNPELCGWGIEQAHLCCTPREQCFAFPHLRLCQGKKTLFAFYAMDNKPAICFRTAEHSTAGTKGSDHRQAHRQVITRFQMSTVAKSMEETLCHALRFVGYPGVTVLRYMSCAPSSQSVIVLVCGKYCKNIRNLSYKQLQFTSSSTISNALMFSTNMSYICAHIQELSKFKLIYLPIIKALQKYFLKNSLRVPSKLFFMNF